MCPPARFRQKHISVVLFFVIIKESPVQQGTGNSPDKTKWSIYNTAPAHPHPIRKIAEYGLHNISEKCPYEKKPHQFIKTTSLCKDNWFCFVRSGSLDFSDSRLGYALSIRLWIRTVSASPNSFVTFCILSVNCSIGRRRIFSCRTATLDTIQSISIMPRIPNKKI